MEMPRKLTVSMLRVTVMMLSDMVESVMEEMEEVRDMAGCRRWRRCFFRLCRACSLDTLLLPGGCRERGLQRQERESKLVFVFMSLLYLNSCNVIFPERRIQ